MEVRGVRKGFTEHMLFELGLEKGVNSLNEDIIVTCVHIKNCQEEGEVIHLWKRRGGQFLEGQFIMSSAEPCQQALLPSSQILSAASSLSEV